MKRRTAALFCMSETGHFQRLRPIIAALSEAGVEVRVYTDAAFRSPVERAGGVFIDLFARYPLERADAASIPYSSRYVAFAAKYAEAVRDDVAGIGASLVIHDTFAVIGRVVATLLGLPRINVCSGHNLPPARILPVLAKDPRVKTSPACLEAVKVLRDKYGWADASPFSYVSSMSSDLNIYCEPPEFLGEADRAPFEPVAFYGTLPAGDERRNDPPGDAPWPGGPGSRALGIYVSFGTIIWRYYAASAIRAMGVIASALAGMKGIRALFSLGGAAVDRSVAAGWTRPNVAVERYVNQWEVLREANAFITHHGINSTHEAIFRLVPMISYPFFWDQPGMAATCRRLGLAVPLAGAVQGEFGEDRVRDVLTRLAGERETLAAALARAREWELAVVRDRPSVHRRILEFME